MSKIHIACGQGDLNQIGELLVGDPDLVDAEDEHCWRPIFHAAIYRQLAAVQLLIDAGADLAADNGAVLHYAAEVLGNHAIVKLLIEYGGLEFHTRPTDDLSRQFLAAIFLGNGRCVESLLRKHNHLATSPDGFGDQPIHHAARCGETDIVGVLIRHGKDVNAATNRGHTVLYCAGGHGHVETVRMLLNAGADAHIQFTADGKTLLQWLEQYPEDTRFQPVAKLLREHLKE